MDQEGIMFKKISPTKYFFPYDSIGFIIDDSIHNVTLYIVESYDNNNDYKNKSELILTIHNTDHASLLINEDRVTLFVVLYLLSVMKVGFDKKLLNTLESVFKNIFNNKINSVEYLDTSLLISLKKMSFITKLNIKENEVVYYKISYTNKKGRKEVLKETDIKNLGFLKKKILKKNKYFPIIYYSIIIIVGALIFLINKKIFIWGLILYIIIRYIYFLFKKNAYKLFSRDKVAINGKG